MKKLALVLTFLMVGTLGLVQAQGVKAFPTASLTDPRPNITAMNNQIINTMMQIVTEVGSGKITKTQGQALMSQLQTLMQQMMTNIKANNMADLTPSQMTNLNSMVTTLNGSL
jgi:hypothetical protein